MSLHPAQSQLLGFMAGSAALPPPQKEIANRCHSLALFMAEDLADTKHGAELTTGLRKLLEAKDCFVRASLGV